jgi:predicted nuclease of predicted toxin-antitoxin system
MIIVDAQLSPNLALWLYEQFQIECCSAKYLGLASASDLVIFKEAKERNAIVLTKDEDFVKLAHQYGSPPKIIWITCGNTSNQRMKELLLSKFQEAITLLKDNDLVEISD